MRELTEDKSIQKYLSQGDMMEVINDYLPRDKSDFERVSKLENLDKSIIVLLIPKLLEWLQDINWPIAMDVATILLKYSEETTPYVKKVLRSNDDIWKDWCLIYFVEKLPQRLKTEFMDDLIRISSNPTHGEKLEEVNETAEMILQSILSQNRFREGNRKGYIIRDNNEGMI